MRDEDDAQLHGIESRDSAIDHRGFRAPHHARAEVDEVGRAVDDDGRRRARAVGIGGRSAGSQQHHLGSRWVLGWLFAAPTRKVAASSNQQRRKLDELTRVIGGPSRGLICGDFATISGRP